VARNQGEDMQQLIKNKVDIAPEIYHKHCNKLDEDSKREIAWYAHRAVDEDEQVVGIYFVDLPSPVPTTAASSNTHYGNERG
jgi:hypothetical protein